MNGRILATVVGLVALTAPVPAHAGGPGYLGGCRIAIANDTTPRETLGGPSTWNGEVDVVVATATDTVTSASCWIKVTATGVEWRALDATTFGPLAVGAGRVPSFLAAVTDAVYLCTHVSINGGAASDVCAPLTPTPICPAQFCGLLDQLVAIFDGISDHTDVMMQFVCPVLMSLGPTVDGLPGGLAYIDVTGDTYVAGTVGPAERVWDCPPYDPPPRAPLYLGEVRTSGW